MSLSHKNWVPKKNWIIACLLFSLIIVLVAKFGPGVYSGFQSKHNHQASEDQEYDSYKKEMVQLVSLKEPEEIFKKMKSDLPNNQMLKSNCRSLTHKIGNAVLEKYNYDVKKALSYSDLLCGSGYIHGVIEYFLKNSKDPEKEIATLCSQIKGVYCPRGLGHGFMLYNDFKIEPSLDLCKKLDFKSQGECSAGVFMEILDAENTSYKFEINSVNTDSPQTLCQDRQPNFRNSCYYYVGRYLYNKNKTTMKNLSSLCEAFNQEDKKNCVVGTGAAIMVDNFFETKNIEKFCAEFNNDSKKDCYRGATDIFLFRNVDTGKTVSDLCSNIQSEQERNTCLGNSNTYYSM